MHSLYILCRAEPLKQPLKCDYWRVSHSKSWTSYMFESKLRRTLFYQPTIYTGFLEFYLFIWLTMSFCLLLQMESSTRILWIQATQQLKTLEGASQDTHVWWTVWASDGRERYCLHGMPFRLGFWASGLIFDSLFFQATYKNVQALQRTRWVITMGQLMYFVKVNVMIYV